MALLAAVGLFVTFKPLMERASRQKKVDEANDSFIQQCIDTADGDACLSQHCRNKEQTIR